MFLDKTKINGNNKLPVEKWPQIFDRMNRLGPWNLQKIVDNFKFLALLCYIFFLSFSRAPFQSFFQESETIL